MGCEHCRGERIVLRAVRGQLKSEICRCAGTCAECDGLGWRQHRREDGTSVSVRCGCAKLERKRKLLERAELPARYCDHTLDRFEWGRLSTDQDWQGHLRNFVTMFQEGDPGLLLCGVTGVGKTHLAIAVLRLLVIEHGTSVRFVEFFDLLHRIRASFGTPGGEAAILGPLSRTPVLVIDELGKGKGSEWELSVLDQLISARYNSNLTTIFTTNYPLVENEKITTNGGPVMMRNLEEIGRLMEGPSLEDQVGHRIYSRVLHMCTPLVLRAKGDYRLLKHRELRS